MNHPQGYLITPDGTQTKITGSQSRWTLSELQEYVGGDLEPIPVPNLSRLMLVDEEGDRKKLPQNPKASEFACRPIVGNAVIVKRGEME